MQQPVQVITSPSVSQPQLVLPQYSNVEIVRLFRSFLESQGLEKTLQALNDELGVGTSVRTVRTEVGLLLLSRSLPDAAVPATRADSGGAEGTGAGPSAPLPPHLQIKQARDPSPVPVAKAATAAKDKPAKERDKPRVREAERAARSRATATPEQQARPIQEEQRSRSPDETDLVLLPAAEGLPATAAEEERWQLAAGPLGVRPQDRDTLARGKGRPLKSVVSGAPASRGTGVLEPDESGGSPVPERELPGPPPLPRAASPTRGASEGPKRRARVEGGGDERDSQGVGFRISSSRVAVENTAPGAVAEEPPPVVIPRRPPPQEPKRLPEPPRPADSAPHLIQEALREEEVRRGARSRSRSPPNGLAGPSARRVVVLGPEGGPPRNVQSRDGQVSPEHRYRRDISPGRWRHDFGASPYGRGPRPRSRSPPPRRDWPSPPRGRLKRGRSPPRQPGPLPWSTHGMPKFEYRKKKW